MVNQETDMYILTKEERRVIARRAGKYGVFTGFALGMLLTSLAFLAFLDFPHCPAQPPPPIPGTANES